MLFSKSMTEEKVLLLAKNLGTDILLQLANEIRQKEAAAADIRTIEGAQDTAAQTDPEKKSLDSNQGFIKNNFFS